MSRARDTRASEGIFSFFLILFSPFSQSSISEVEF